MDAQELAKIAEALDGQGYEILSLNTGKQGQPNYTGAAQPTVIDTVTICITKKGA